MIPHKKYTMFWIKKVFLKHIQCFWNTHKYEIYNVFKAGIEKSGIGKQITDSLDRLKKKVTDFFLQYDY